MSTKKALTYDENRLGDGVTVDYDENGEQTLVVFEGDQVGAIVAIEDDVDPEQGIALVDTIEAEIGHAVSGLRSIRRSFIERVDHGDRE